MLIFQSYIGNLSLDFTEGLTLSTAIGKLKDNYSFTFRGEWSVQDTTDGRVLGVDEILLDGRLYQLNGWIQNRP